MADTDTRVSALHKYIVTSNSERKPEEGVAKEGMAGEKVREATHRLVVLGINGTLKLAGNGLCLASFPIHISLSVNCAESLGPWLGSSLVPRLHSSAFYRWSGAWGISFKLSCLYPYYSRNSKNRFEKNNYCLIAQKMDTN